MLLVSERQKRPMGGRRILTLTFLDSQAQAKKKSYLVGSFNIGLLFSPRQMPCSACTEKKKPHSSFLGTALPEEIPPDEV